jgi:transmembrane sensor
VTLRRGEALFRVKQDATRPFVVEAGGVAVRAVGTAFSVRLEAQSVHVLVTEGRVAVAGVADGRSLLPEQFPGEAVPVLLAGQRIAIVAATGAAPQPARVEELAPPSIAAQLAWRMARIEFEGITLAQAVAQLNRANSVQIVLADAAIGLQRISGTFAPDDPRTFARLAAASLGLETEDRGDGRIVLRAAAARE